LTCLQFVHKVCFTTLSDIVWIKHPDSVCKLSLIKLTNLSYEWIVGMPKTAEVNKSIVIGFKWSARLSNHEQNIVKIAISLRLHYLSGLITLASGSVTWGPEAASSLALVRLLLASLRTCSNKHHIAHLNLSYSRWWFGPWLS
jgi:hypothetical protein